MNNETMRERFYKEFTDGCDAENDYYDSSFTEGRPCRVYDFIEQETARAVAEREKEILLDLQEFHSFIQDGIEACTSDAKNKDIPLVGNELHYVFGKSQTLKILKLKLNELLALITPPSEGEDNGK